MTQGRLIDIWIFLFIIILVIIIRGIFSFCLAFVRIKSSSLTFVLEKLELLTLAPVAPEDSLCGLVN